jgi:hypothetical protein
MTEPSDFSTCQFEVSKYFECVDNNKNNDDIMIKDKCFSFIDDYYKCVDIRSYNKSQEKKMARSLKKQDKNSNIYYDICNKD